ncbi:MAG: hypothetical protein JJT93_12955 [Gammaproteobacteria bacterium]|nr:hypothetical protein [Gammaproteobacteria bacterium]
MDMSEWMKVMLEEIERKREEAEAAREEQAARQRESTPERPDTRKPPAA